MERVYDITLEPLFQPLQQQDIDGLAASLQPWTNRTLCRVNDCVVRLGVIHGDFHWHSHESEDEFFYVVSGRLKLQFEDRTVELGPGQGALVPRGTPHFPQAPEPTVLLMVEGAGVNPIGD